MAAANSAEFPERGASPPAIPADSPGPVPIPRRPRWRRGIVKWLVILAGIYLVWCSLLYALQDRMLFPRHMAGPALPVAPRGMEPLWIDAEEDGERFRVEAWFMAAHPADAARRPLVVFFHGNGELIDHQTTLADDWSGRGFNVLLPEYRGYGRSGGSPSEKAIVADAIRFIDAAAARPDVDPSRIIYHGRSLGSGVAAQVAARRKPAALILECAFTSVARFAGGYGVPRALVKNPFRTDRVLPTLGVPVLILHAGDDEIIPVSHGRRLHEITPGSRYAELAGSHNAFPANPAAYWKAIEAFLAGAGLTPDTR